MKYNEIHQWFIVLVWCPYADIVCGWGLSDGEIFHLIIMMPSLQDDTFWVLAFVGSAFFYGRNLWKRYHLDQFYPGELAKELRINVRVELSELKINNVSDT